MSPMRVSVPGFEAPDLNTIEVREELAKSS